MSTSPTELTKTIPAVPLKTSKIWRSSTQKVHAKLARSAQVRKYAQDYLTARALYDTTVSSWIERALGHALFATPDFTLHGAINWMMWMDNEYFAPSYKAVFGIEALTIPIMNNVAQISEASQWKHLEVFFLTCALNSIRNHYGSYEVQILMHASLFMLDIAHDGYRFNPLALLTRPEVREFMIKQTNDGRFAKMLQVLTAIANKRVHLVSIDLRTQHYELKYHNIWDECKE